MKVKEVRCKKSIIIVKKATRDQKRVVKKRESRLENVCKS